MLVVCDSAVASGGRGSGTSVSAVAPRVRQEVAIVSPDGPVVVFPIGGRHCRSEDVYVANWRECKKRLFTCNTKLIALEKSFVFNSIFLIKDYLLLRIVV